MRSSTILCRPLSLSVAMEHHIRTLSSMTAITASYTKTGECILTTYLAFRVIFEYAKTTLLFAAGYQEWQSARRTGREAHTSAAPRRLSSPWWWVCWSSMALERPSSWQIRTMVHHQEMGPLLLKLNNFCGNPLSLGNKSVKSAHISELVNTNGSKRKERSLCWLFCMPISQALVLWVIIKCQVIYLPSTTLSI